jgi:hypothetical protein
MAYIYWFYWFYFSFYLLEANSSFHLAFNSNMPPTIMMVNICHISITTACEKDKNVESNIIGSWAYTAMTINLGLPNPNSGSPITDFFFQMSPCDRDNFITLKSGGTYQVEEGATKCAETDPTIVESGKWVLSADEKTISVTPTNDSPYEFEVVEAGKGQLRLNRAERYNGVNYTIAMTLKAKEILP